MANYQNNMRYGRQMPQNSGCRNNMPSGSGRMPDASRRQEPMPNDGCRNRGCAPMPNEGCHNNRSESERCPAPAPCNNDCNSGTRNTMNARNCLEGLPIAMAYVPWQRWQNLFDPCKALQCGTIFEELFKPFHGKGGCNR